MELSYAFFFLFSLIPVIYLFVKTLNQKNGGISAVRLPPGRTGFPLIGETLDYHHKYCKGSLFEFVKDRMDKFSPKVFRTSLIGQQAAVLCGPEGNKFLFSNENKLVQLWWPSKLEKLFPKSGKKYNVEQVNKIRRIIVQSFVKGDRLRERVGLMDAAMKQHLQTYWIGKDEVIVGEMAKKFALTIACNFFLGTDDLSQIENIVQEVEEISAAIFSSSINLPGTALNRGIRASKSLRSKIEAIIRQRKADLRERKSSSSSTIKDFITLMLLEEDGNGESMEDGNIASDLVALLSAAYGGLQSTITTVMMKLSELPDVYDSVLKEQTEIALLNKSKTLSSEDLRKMKYSWNVACEVLRVYPQSPGGFRVARMDFTYEGYMIPKGWMIHYIFDATHKNPKYFKEPQKFDPTRFEGDGPEPYTYIPFGGGPRTCPGNEYARMAILIFVHYVVTEFKWTKSIPDENFIFSSFPHPAQGLPIRIYPRN